MMSRTDFAKLALATLDKQRAFFRELQAGRDAFALLDECRAIEHRLRQEAEKQLQPPGLFDEDESA